MAARDKLNVIIPLYNPHPGWENHFMESATELRNELEETELTVILVNDGSTLQEQNIERLTSNFIFLKYYSYPSNKGKGHAIRYGINMSEADYYVYTDLDFPFGCRIVSQTYRLLKSSNANIVVGTRDIAYFRKLPFKRKIYSVMLKNLNYLITGFRIKDTQAGLKGIDNKAKKILSQTKTNTFLFELEFLKESLRQGLKIELINISCRPGTRFTDFRFKTLFVETLNFFKIIFR